MTILWYVLCAFSLVLFIIYFYLFCDESVSVCDSVAAVSLIDLLQIVRHDSVVGDASHHRESLVTAPSHQMDVVLKVPQAVPLRDLVYVHRHLRGIEEREGKEEKKGPRISETCKFQLNWLISSSFSLYINKEETYFPFFHLIFLCVFHSSGVRVGGKTISFDFYGPSKTIYTTLCRSVFSN